jgi:xylan 1,4-beta-xylosidase
MYLCGRANGGHYTTLGRETALDPVHWTEDGWFVVNDTTPSTEQKMPLPSYTFDEKYNDDFDCEKLSLDWEWVRNPNDENYSLTERKGWLRLYTLNGRLCDISAENTLVRRETELKYTAETRLQFNPENDGEQAGLVCYYATNTYIRFGIVYDGGIKLQLAVNRNNGEEVVKTEEISCTDIRLSVEVNGLERSFYYDIGDGKQFFAKVENCIFLCDEGVKGDKKRHTGTLVGMYANNGGNGRRINADFDWFNYSC